MFRKTLLLPLAVFASCALSLPAQDDPSQADPSGNGKGKAAETTGPARFWQATVAGGHFMVALDRIVSVSRHKYVLDGSVMVDEVTVDTTGQALARFYFLSPLSEAVPDSTAKGVAKRGQELLEDAAGQQGVTVQDMVQKKYPETTHAKEIEYRLATEAQLAGLYASVRAAWESGRGRQFSAK